MSPKVIGRHDYGWSGPTCNSTVLKGKKDKTLLLVKYGTA